MLRRVLGERLLRVHNNIVSTYLQKAITPTWEKEFRPAVVDVKWLDRRYKRAFRNNGCGQVVTSSIGGFCSVSSLSMQLFKGDYRDLMVDELVNQMKGDFKGKDKFVALPDTLTVIIKEEREHDVVNIGWKCYGVVVKKGYFKRRVNDGHIDES